MSKSELTDYYDIVCPKCKSTIHVPYFKNLEAKTKEELDKEITDALIEALEDRGYFNEETK